MHAVGSIASTCVSVCCTSLKRLRRCICKSELTNQRDPKVKCALGAREDRRLGSPLVRNRLSVRLDRWAMPKHQPFTRPALFREPQTELPIFRRSHLIGVDTIDSGAGPPPQVPGRPRSSFPVFDQILAIAGGKRIGRLGLGKLGALVARSNVQPELFFPIDLVQFGRQVFFG